MSNFTMITQQSKEDLIRIALSESGKISGCFSMFRDFSGTNAWLLGIQQIERGLDVSPVMSTKGWVRAGIISEETRKKMIRQALYARVPQSFPIYEKDEEGKTKRDKDGKAIVAYTKTSFPFAKAFLSYSQFKKSDLLKEHKVECSFDMEEVASRLGLSITTYQSVDGNCQGYCTPSRGTIAINPLAENPQKTFIHEVAHCLLHKGELRFVDGKQLTRDIREAEAELTSYVVNVMLGASDDELAYSRGYIQSWLGGLHLSTEEIIKQVKPKNMARICTAIDIIMKAIANYKGAYTLESSGDLKKLKDVSEG